MFAYRGLAVRHRDDLARLVTGQHGKTLDDARGEVQRGLEVIEFACGLPHLLKGEFSEQVSTAVDMHSLRPPLGVAAGITPFNFPVRVPMWMFPMAIACGNTFVLKPSERDPSSSNARSPSGLPGRDLRARARRHVRAGHPPRQRQPYGNGTAVFTNDGGAARKFKTEIEVGMVGVNVPIPVPLAFYSFGGWKHSLFGSHDIYGSDGISFYTRPKTVISRWPDPVHRGVDLGFPTAG
jgi:acyl-CoA reductase-like NAD-dependent aldehyde dehydrogenase